MSARIWIPVAFLLSILAGTIADTPPDRSPIYAGGYRVLAGDFHLHSGLGGGGTLTPWGLVTQAQRQELDVVALTGHNTTWDAHAAHAFSRIASGPIVLMGEEITSKTQDLIAVGIETSISPALPLTEQIAEIHRQGGIAIAAHPVPRFHLPYSSTGANTMIDGTEVCHPIMYELAGSGQALADFADATRATPIGSSDFHSTGRPGLCRTFVFVTEATERGVIQALRDHRTVTYGVDGRAFGDPALITLAARAGLPAVAARFKNDHGGTFDWISRLTAGAALFGVALSLKPRASRPAGAPLGSDPHAPARSR